MADTQPARARRSRWPLIASAVALIAVGAVAAAQLWPEPPPPTRHAPATTVVAAAPALPVPAPTPAPQPVVETWRAHRDLAVTYHQRRQHAEAFREVESALDENRAAASADPALVAAAVGALARDRVARVVEAFRANPRLVEALAEATAKGATAELRHAAHEGLRSLGQEARADAIAMWILDLEQAAACRPMRAAYRQLRSSSDPRVAALKAELRKRNRWDPHVRCLKRVLRR